MAWRLVYDTLFSRYLLLTNTAVSCGLEVLGDFIVQKIENPSGHIDLERIKRMAIIGLILGPPQHFWFKLLDKRYPGKSTNAVIKKVILDETINGPSCIVVFFLGMNLMSGLTWKDSVKDMKEKFFPVFKAELVLWPAAQVLNFRCVPNSLRVTYVSVVYLVWVMFLSYYHHRKKPEISQQE